MQIGGEKIRSACVASLGQIRYGQIVQQDLGIYPAGSGAVGGMYLSEMAEPEHKRKRAVIRHFLRVGESVRVLYPFACFPDGNLLFCKNSSGAGFLYLQEAPPSGERRDMETCDFRVKDGEIHSCSWGIHPSEIRPGKTFRGYRHDLLVCHSDEER